MVHGEDGLAAAERITASLFSGDVEGLTEADLEQLKLDGIPFSRLPVGDLDAIPLTSLLAEAGMARAAREVKDALGRQAVFLNGVPKSLADNMKSAECFAPVQACYGRFFLVRLGKKKYHLFERPE